MKLISNIRLVKILLCVFGSASNLWADLTLTTEFNSSINDKLSANASKLNNAPVLRNLITGDYQFDKGLAGKKDAFRAYKSICGGYTFCSKSGGSFQQKKWTCHGCPPCSCSDDCNEYGNCCPDLAITKTNFWTDGIDGENLRNLMSCRSYIVNPCTKQSKDYDEKSPSGVIMVDKCPRQYSNKIIRSLCEGPDEYFNMQKTFVVSSNHLTYRNIYCARCHGVSENFIDFWEPLIKSRDVSKASSVSSLSELWSQVVRNNGYCSYSVKPPKGSRPRWCWWPETVINRCNVTGDWKKLDKYVETMCLKPLVSVIAYTKGLTYKNIYCASCNGELTANVQGCISNKITEGTFSFAALINFNPSKALMSAAIPPTEPPDRQKCSNGSVKNPISGKCQKPLCEERYYYDNSSDSCVSLFDTVRGLGYNIMLNLKPENKSVDVELELLTLDILWQSQGYLETISREYSIDPLVIEVVSDGVPILPKTLKQTIPLKEVDVSLNIVTLSLERPSKYLPYLRTKMLNTWVLFASRLRLIPTEIHPCSKNLLDLNRSQMFRFVQAKRVLFRNKCFPPCSVTNYVNLKSMLKCPHLKFNVNQANVTVISNETVIRIGKYTIKNMSLSDYHICHGVVKICTSAINRAVNKYYRVTRPKKDIIGAPNDKGLIILSIVTTTLSLLGCFLTFITYCLFRELRTLPGLNTMGLVANLFTAQIVFQMGIKPTGNDAVCRILGIAIHYLWMASFAWMAVCAFHMFYTFRNVVLTRMPEDKGNRFIVYVVFGNIVPVILPVICAVYNRFALSDINLGYGGSVCFLNTPKNIGYFFAVPIGLVLVFNIVLFSITVYFLRQSFNTTSSLLRYDKQNTYIYIRMSALLGITWVFGLIAGATNSMALWYLFTITNGFQGVFIFIAYCFKRRIFYKYVKFITGKETGSSNSGSSSKALKLTSSTNSHQESTNLVECREL